MSKLLKATKKITAVAASTLLLSSATFSAGLNDYGSNFVEKGKFVGQVVVGSSAGADDMTAANLIVNQLKAKYSGSEEQVQLSFRKGTTSGSSKSLGDDFFVGANISGQEKGFDGDDLDLFASKVFKDEGGKEYDYTQEVKFSEQKVQFDHTSSLTEVGYTGSKPTYYVNLETSNPVYTLEATFEDSINVTLDSVKGQEIELFGRTLTFSNENTEGGNIVLLSSLQTVTLDSSGKTETSIEHEGKTYKIKVLSGNSAGGRANIEVNGLSKIISEKDGSQSINGLDLFVKEVFVSDIVIGGSADQKEIMVKLAIGSNEIVIDDGAVTSEKKLEVNGEKMDNYKVTYTGSQTELTGIQFHYYPNKKDEMDKETNFLVSGSSVNDPVFPGVSFSYDGKNMENANNIAVKLADSNDVVELNFKSTYSNEEVSLNLYNQTDGTDVNVFSDSDSKLRLSVAADTEFVANDIFIIEDADVNNEEIRTYIYKVDDMDFSSNGRHEVTLTNLVTGDEKIFKLKGPAVPTTGEVAVDLKEILETGVSFSKVKLNTSSGEMDSFKLNSGTLNRIYAKDGVKITIAKASSTVNASLLFEEVGVDDRDNTILGSFNLNFALDTVAKEFKSINLVDVNNTKGTGDNNDNSYSYTPIGSVTELDDDKENFKMAYPTTEIEHLFTFSVGGKVSDLKTVLVPKSKVTATVAAKKAEGYSEVSRTTKKAENVEFTVTAPVKDSEATKMDNIVVGGPMVNSQAVSLLNGAQTLVKGQAMVKYFSASNSILAYGYTKAGTLEAVKSLNSGATSGAKITVKE